FRGGYLAVPTPTFKSRKGIRTEWHKTGWWRSSILMLADARFCFTQSRRGAKGEAQILCELCDFA
ncbi:MAG: hypothetical protein RIB86_13160, partial [Imperialibacter sp.]